MTQEDGGFISKKKKKWTIRWREGDKSSIDPQSFIVEVTRISSVHCYWSNQGILLCLLSIVQACVGGNTPALSMPWWAALISIITSCLAQAWVTAANQRWEGEGHITQVSIHFSYKKEMSVYNKYLSSFLDLTSQCNKLFLSYGSKPN